MILIFGVIEISGHRDNKRQGTLKWRRFRPQEKQRKRSRMKNFSQRPYIVHGCLSFECEKQDKYILLRQTTPVSYFDPLSIFKRRRYWFSLNDLVFKFFCCFAYWSYEGENNTIDSTVQKKLNIDLSQSKKHKQTNTAFTNVKLSSQSRDLLVLIFVNVDTKISYL